MRRGVRLRRDARNGLEDAMEMKPAHPRGCRQCVEAGRHVGAFNHAAGRRDGRGALLGERRLVRPAALARAEAGTLRVGAGAMKAHVIAARAPGGT
jgi:hypothetical protein